MENKYGSGPVNINGDGTINITSDNLRTICDAININASILMDIISRIEKIEDLMEIEEESVEE